MAQRDIQIFLKVNFCLARSWTFCERLFVLLLHEEEKELFKEFVYGGNNAPYSVHTARGVAPNCFYMCNGERKVIKSENIWKIC